MWLLILLVPLALLSSASDFKSNYSGDSKAAQLSTATVTVAPGFLARDGCDGESKAHCQDHCGHQHHILRNDVSLSDPLLTSGEARVYPSEIPPGVYQSVETPPPNA